MLRTQWEGANLSFADLSEAALTGANLTRAVVTGARVTAADLCQANLEGAILHRACLRGANLTEANLRRANLSYADLTRARLFHAEMLRTSLEFADLTGADLRTSSLAYGYLGGAVFTGARCDLGEICDRLRKRWNGATGHDSHKTLGGARRLALTLQTLAQYVPGPELRSLLPLLRRALTWWYASSVEQQQWLRTAVESIEAATASWKDLPLPSDASASQGTRPIPASSETEARRLPLPGRHGSEDAG